jgi:hypothetical protein
MLSHTGRVARRRSVAGEALSAPRFGCAMPVGVASRLGGVFFADSARGLLQLRTGLFWGIAAIVCFVNARPASASCGDYVTIGNPSANAQAHDATAMTSAETPQHAEQAPLAPVPCHGPSCRRVPHPFAVPNTPPPSWERSHENWARLSDEVGGHETAGLRRCGEFDAPPLAAVWYPATWRPPEAI